jgi:hypothetical protein
MEQDLSGAVALNHIVVGAPVQQDRKWTQDEDEE